MRVLLVEDDDELRDVTRRALMRRGLAVDEAVDGADALAKVDVNDYDVVVLDRDLSVMHGDEVCRSLVARGIRTRVLMLTAAAETEDVVDGLALGADDYLRKPFEVEELFARTIAVGRRATPVRPPELLSGDVRLDSARRGAWRDGRDLRLTRKEFGVLEVLLVAQGDTVSTEVILERVWDENIDPFTNVLRITMMTLRRKLADPAVIETVVGVGYRLAVADVAS